jgi:hypothetical protein
MKLQEKKEWGLFLMDLRRSMRKTKLLLDSLQTNLLYSKLADLFPLTPSISQFFHRRKVVLSVDPAAWPERNMSSPIDLLIMTFLFQLTERFLCFLDQFQLISILHLIYQSSLSESVFVIFVAETCSSSSLAFSPLVCF